MATSYRPGMNTPLARRLFAISAIVVAGTLVASATSSARKTPTLGPIGTTVSGPTASWVGQQGIRRTNSEIMAAKEDGTMPPGETAIAAYRSGRRLVDGNADRASSAEPTAASYQQRLPKLAQTPVTPNVDVATLADTGSFPPDTMGDVGPAQYLVGVNGRIRTISKATGLADGALDATMNAFFASVRNGFSATDPRVRYDRRSGRWFVVAINLTLSNRFMVAVSDAAVLTSSTAWTFHHWGNTRTEAGTPANQCIADYPTLGIDEDALYVGANQFCGPALGAALNYDSSSVYVVKKAPLVQPAPGSLEVTAFDELSLGSGAGPYAPQGVDNFDENTSTGYVIGVDNAVLSRLQVRRIADPGGSPSISANLTIDVPSTSGPIDVPHPGGAANLDVLDDRLQQAVVRGGRLWTNHHIQVDGGGVGSGSGGRNGIRWYEIENLATTPSVRQVGTVFDSAVTNPASYFYGSMMVSGQGHMALGANVAGATTFVNAVATGRLASDPLNELNAAPVAYTTNSSFTYNAEVPPEPQRWGEHSYTSLDPSDDMTMWTLQQYVNADDSFALRLVRLAAPPPALVTSLSPSSVGPNQTNVSITVTGTSVGGSGFFDPGPAFANRIAAAFGRGASWSPVWR